MIILRLSLLLLCLPVFDMTAQDFRPYPERHRRLVQSISFSPDGQEMYFSLMYREYREATGLKVNDNTPRLAIFMTYKIASGWSEPEMLPFSGQYKDYEPSLSPDGTVMFFNSNRPVQGQKPSAKNNLWFSRKVNGQWQAPEYMPQLNNEAFEESYASISKAGDLYFVAERLVNGKSEYALYHTKFEGTGTRDGKKLKVLDIPQGTGDPWVAPDNTYVIFTKFDNDQWNTTCDLYISFNKRGKWSAPMPMTALNGEGPDFAVAISPDEQWIYYRKNFRFIKVPFQPVLKNLRRTFRKSGRNRD